MLGDGSITPWRLAWRAKGMALRAAVAPFALVTVLYAGLEPIEDVLRHSIGAAWLPVYEGLYTSLDALQIGTLLEAMRSSAPRWLPSRRAIGFALAFLPPGALLSVPHFFLRLGLNGDLGKGGPHAAPWEMVLFQHPMQWLVLGLAVAPLARRLLRLPPLPATQPSPGALPAIDVLVGMLLIAAVLASCLALGLRTVLAVPDTLWGAVPGVGHATIAGHAGALVSWYAATYVVTLLVAAGIVPLLWRRVSPGEAR